MWFIISKIERIIVRDVSLTGDAVAVGKGKGKGAVPNAGHRRGAHLPF